MDFHRIITANGNTSKKIRLDGCVASEPLWDMQNLDEAVSPISVGADDISTTELETPSRDRWEKIVQTLMETNGLSIWHRLKTTSLLYLPDEVIAIYDAFEADGCFNPLNQDEKKQFFRSFFKKALGSAVINALQLEELVHEQVDVADVDVREMIQNLPVNNGLFDFRSFISMVYEINNLLVTRHNLPTVACWKYWYYRLIPIHPNFVLKQAWDVMIMILLVYSCFQVPYSMAFDDNVDTNHMSPTYVADVLLDVIFMVDVVLCFFTAYYDVKGMLVKDLRKISKRYTRTWFAPDLGGSFPFDTVIGLFLDSSGNMGAMRILKMVRLLKLIRAVRVFHFLGELAHKDGFAWLKSTIRVLRSLFLIIFAAHALGCFFYLFFVPESDVNWMYTYRPNLRTADDWTRYVTAMYWATISITTMGYGDIVPVTHSERIFCIVVALVGAIVFSYCMGTITSLLNSVTGADYRIAEKLQQATEYVLFRESTTKLKRLIKSFYNLSWRKSGELYKEQQIIFEISTPLRKVLLAEIGFRSKAQIPLFQGFEDECIGYIFTLLKRVDFSEGGVIYQKGEPAAEMYLVTSGKVSILMDGNRRYSTSEMSTRSGRARVMEAGGSFGELSLFPDLIPPIRHETAVASSWVIAYTLAAADVPRLQAKYPHVVSRLREFCQLKIADGRARGHTYASKRSSCRVGAAVKHCKLKTVIAQMQRNLLRVKEQSMLMPLAGEFGMHGKKLLKLLVQSDVHNDDYEESEQGKLTSVSCVLSSEGELLCIEHTTQGITGDGLRSLAFVVPGLSAYRVLESDEVWRGARRAMTGGAQLFGCCVTAYERPFIQSTEGDGCSSAMKARQVHLYSWLEEELEALFDCLDHWTQGNFPVGALDGLWDDSRTASQECLPLQQPEAVGVRISSEQCQYIVHSSTMRPNRPCEIPNVFGKAPTLQLLPGVLHKLKAQSEQINSKSQIIGRGSLKPNYQRVQRIDSELLQDAADDSKKHKGASAFSSGSCKSSANNFGCLSADDIVENADCLLGLALELEENPRKQLYVLCQVFTRHVILIKSLVESLHDIRQVDSCKGSLRKFPLGDEGETIEVRTFETDPHVKCEATVFGADFGSDRLSHDDEYFASNSHATYESVVQAVSERYKTKDPIEVLGRTCTGPERRWEALVNQLMETHGLYGWHRFQQSLFGLSATRNTCRVRLPGIRRGAYI